jgi:hypothetical protein
MQVGIAPISIGFVIALVVLVLVVVFIVVGQLPLLPLGLLIGLLALARLF